MKKADDLPSEIRIYPQPGGDLVVSITVKYYNDMGEPIYVSDKYIASPQRVHSILEFFKHDIQIIHSTEGLYG